MSEVIRLVQTAKNGFKPINRIPPEIFALIPQYYDKQDLNEKLILLTHVCQRWREILIAYSPLWTLLDCTNTEKTRAFIERSRSSHLHISLTEYGRPYYLRDAFHLVAPHIGRVASLQINGGGGVFQTFTEYFSRSVPVLKNLDIDFVTDTPLNLNGTLFDGDLSSLRTLRLSGVIPDLPKGNLSKLNTFTLRRVTGDEISFSQLLDFFASAPLLSKIDLGAIPYPPDAPPGRVVPLPYLKSLVVLAGATPSSTLLNHLSIPTGALLHLHCYFGADMPTLQKCLPETPKYLQNVSFITSINLDFSQTEFFIQLDGPSGALRIYCSWDTLSLTGIGSADRRILRSLDYFTLSKIRKLAVTDYESSPLSRINWTSTRNRARGQLLSSEEAEVSSPHYILRAMNNLRELSLTRCNDLPFIRALNPGSTLGPALCPKLEKLILHAEQETLNIRWLEDMARVRASKGVRLRSITVATEDELVPEEEVSKLREYVASVELELDP